MIQSVESKPGEGMTLRKVSHQGMSLSASQRRRLEQQRALSANRYQGTDWDALRDRFNQPVSYSDSRESLPLPYDPYWLLVDSMKKYGREIPEESFTGTPWLGAAFGYSQENYQ